MTAKTHTARARAWTTAFTKYVNLNQRLEQAQGETRDALELAVAAQQDDFLDLPSPSFAAVVCKLETLWEADLHGLDAGSEQKRLILEDLQDLMGETADLIGARA